MIKSFQQLKETLDMGKVKELPYNEGYNAAKAGGRTRDNPYWEGYEKNNMEWAFHSWLNGWSDFNNEKIVSRRMEKNG